MKARKAEGELLSFEEVLSKRGLGETMKVTSPYGEYLLDKNGNEFVLLIDDLIKLSEDESFIPDWYDIIYEWAGIYSGMVSKNIILLLAENLKNIQNE